MERKSRTISKIVLWRFITLCVTVSVLFVYTQNFYVASTIGIIDHSICFVFHYFYERIWSNIKWGIIQDSNTKSNKQSNPETSLQVTEI
tara:strand:+ start:186 stop:452 length:267 start_codon:yes stop_codon:yes gene_type:complete